MSAIRLARGFTKRDKIIKFSGCYHGHSDSFLIAAGSGLSTFGIPNSPGVTEGTAKDTLLANYNDIENVKALFEANKNEIAAIIIEPVAGNMGCIPPANGFLESLRTLCSENQTLLIFDEVMTGFRLAKGGVQELYNIQADIVCFGKVIGGGLPVGAFAARAEIMNFLAPLGPVYQAGTLSGNPLAMAAGLEMLKALNNDATIFESLENKTAYLEKGIDKVLTRLTSFAQQNNVMIFLIAHPTKMQKIKDSQIYEVPDLYNVSGSSDFRNQTHDGYSIYRTFPDAAGESYTTFTNLKTKHSFQGDIGGAAEFEYHVPTGRYYARGTNPPLFDMTKPMSEQTLPPLQPSALQPNTNFYEPLNIQDDDDLLNPF
jgi:glutamate-1-semialdehyde-2,1-aminomutase